MATSTANYQGFNLAPNPGGGAGPYGMVPGQIGAPPSIYSQVGQVAPGLPGLTAGSAGNIASEIAGTLSPGTTNLIQNKAAAFGVNAGTPGGTPGNTLPLENLLDNTGMTSESLSSQGNANYLNFLGGVGQTQLAPSLLTDIASNNAINASAPNPAAAAQKQQQLLQQYLYMLNNANKPAGPTGYQQEQASGNFYIPPGSTTMLPIPRS